MRLKSFRKSKTSKNTTHKLKTSKMPIKNISVETKLLIRLHASLYHSQFWASTWVPFMLFMLVCAFLCLFVLVEKIEKSLLVFLCLYSSVFYPICAYLWLFMLLPKSFVFVHVFCASTWVPCAYFMLVCAFYVCLSLYVLVESFRKKVKCFDGIIYIATYVIRLILQS